jgi:1-acyl-sn-glycerol-3-phosphate acyltransferase
MNSAETSINVSRASEFYSGCRNIVRWIFDLFYELEVFGLEKIPARGGVIFASNHASFLDPPAIGCWIDRQLHYFARSSLWRPPLGWVLDRLEVIPVKRNENDVQALRGIFKALSSGGSIALFPEGTRSTDGTMLPAKGGAGMLACRNQAVVIPTRIFGSFEAFSRNDPLPRLFRPVRVIYGDPLYPQDYDPGKAHAERYLEASRRIMQAIERLSLPTKPVV